MNFQSDIENMVNNFDVLKNQASSTSEAWNDSVQRKYYDQFINNLPKEFQNFINELDKLDKAFESAENTISNL